MAALWLVGRWPSDKATALLKHCFADVFVPCSWAHPLWEVTGIWECLCSHRSQARILKHLVCLLFLEMFYFLPKIHFPFLLWLGRTWFWWWVGSPSLGNGSWVIKLSWHSFLHFLWFSGITYPKVTELALSCLLFFGSDCGDSPLRQWGECQEFGASACDRAFEPAVYF